MMVHGRRVSALTAVCSLLILGFGVAGVAQAATQIVTPAIGTVQATGSPVLAGSGKAWNGPAVAVVDSGVDVHTELNLAGSMDCTGLGTADGNGHGTGVSGLIAAKDDGKGIVGVAPGAPIYSVRVLDAKLKGSTATVQCGLQWVLDNAAAKNIKVVNLSLASPGADDGNCGYTNNDTMHQLVCALTGAGVTVVASAGNESKDLSYMVPAAYDEALTATNVADYDGIPGGHGTSPCTAVEPDDTAYSSSNFAVSASDKAHVLASPGVCPYTTKKGNQIGYIQSGTSMSAAALSGVVLDCLRSGGACEGESVSQIRGTIMSAASAAASAGHVFTGDPMPGHAIAGKDYGYLASTATNTGGSGTSTVPTTSISATSSDTTTSAVGTITATSTTPTDTSTTTTPTTTTPTDTSTTATPTDTSTTATPTDTSTTATPTDTSTTATPSDTSTTATSTTATSITTTDTAATTATTTATQSSTVVSMTTGPPPAPCSVTTQPVATTTTSATTTASPDKTPPATTVIAPADLATVTATTCLRASASDGIGVTSVAFWVGTTKLGDAILQPSGSWDLAVLTTRFTNGTYSVVSKAKDRAGNQGVSTVVRLIVRN